MWLKNSFRSSRHGTTETNLSIIHEDTGSICGLTQWVKNPVLLWAVGVGWQLQLLIWRLAWKPPHARDAALKWPLKPPQIPKTEKQNSFIIFDTHWNSDFGYWLLGYVFGNSEQMLWRILFKICQLGIFLVLWFSLWASHKYLLVCTVIFTWICVAVIVAVLWYSMFQNTWVIIR